MNGLVDSIDVSGKKLRTVLLSFLIFAIGVAATSGQKPSPPTGGGSGGGTGSGSGGTLKPVASGGGTSSSTASPNFYGSNSYTPFDAPNTQDPDYARRQRLTRLFAEDRLKKNTADSEKLLNLAKELNDEYAKPVPASVTDSQLNKVKEIEKLAKRVKQRLVYNQ